MIAFLAACQIQSLASPRQTFSAPRLETVDGLPRTRSRLTSYHFWLDRLVDECAVTNPSWAMFRSEKAYREAKRFRAFIDRSEFTEIARHPDEARTSGLDLFCLGLLRWSRATTALEPSKRESEYSLAEKAFSDAKSRLITRSPEEADQSLPAYIDLARAVCLADETGLNAKATLYSVEVEWRNRYPHSSLAAAFHLGRLYEEAGDKEKARETYRRIVQRYVSQADFFMYRMSQLKSDP